MFSLRYKFSLVILLLLGLSFGSAWLLLKHRLEQQLLSDLQRDLQQAAKLQLQRQQEMALSLRQTAQALQDSQHLHRLLRQAKTTPVQPSQLEAMLLQYPNAHMLLLYDAQAQRQATSLLANDAGLLRSLPESVLRTERLATQWLYLPQRSLYLVSAPIMEGQHYLGQLLLLAEITQQTLNAVQAATGFAVLLFHQGHLQLHSDGLDAADKQTWLASLQNNPLPDEFAAQVPAFQSIATIQLSHANWLYASTLPQDDAPLYVFMRSTTQQLMPLNQLGWQLLLLSLGILLAGFILVWPLFRQINHSARSLQIAAEQIEKENYHYRTQIQSADEFAQLGKALNQVMNTLQEREQLYTAMETLVSKELAEEMLRQNLHSAGEEHFATVLFSGIRDFSHAVSTTAAPELLALLNNYFTRMDFCVNAHGGFIDKYFGDNVLALFGLRHAEQQATLAAAQAAREMEEALRLFNLETGQRHRQHWKIGIGIHAGLVVAGNVGAEDRQHYSVIGNPVRLASNLEKLCKQYGVSVLLSQSAHEHLRQDPQAQGMLQACRELDIVQFGRHTEALKIVQLLPRAEYDRIQHTDFLARFQEARTYLQEHNFRLAQQSFHSLQEDWPEDAPTRLLLNRCRRYMQDSARFSLENPQGAYVLTAVA